MTYRPYTADELATCLGMRVKHKRSGTLLMITEIDDGFVLSHIWEPINPDELRDDWLDLSTDQPCGVLDLEKEELPR